MTLSRFLWALVLLAPLGLGGCVGLAVKGVKTAETEVTISSNAPAASRGDARAQYKVGAAYCCAIGSLDLVHDNAKATDWLCLSAQQDYQPAQYLLGKIYSGKPVSGVNLEERAKLMLVGAPQNLPVAALWLTRAARDGDHDAMSALADMTPRLSAGDQVLMHNYLRDWRAAPCTWKSVFPYS